MVTQNNLHTKSINLKPLISFHDVQQVLNGLQETYFLKTFANPFKR